MSYSKEIAKALLKIKAVKLNPQKPFIWSSGLKSPIYCDNRISLSHPNVRNLIINGFVELVKSNLNPLPDCIAGVATAGIPHGALLADRLNLPFIYVRSKAKAHGRQNLIEGEWQPAAKVVVVEDLISTGGSSLKAVEALRAAGLDVQRVIAIFNYGFAEAKNNFQHANCTFNTLTNFREMVEIAIQNGYIQAGESELLEEWITNPTEWDPKV